MHPKLQASTWLLLGLCLEVNCWAPLSNSWVIAPLQRESGSDRAVARARKLGAKRRYDDSDDELDYEIRRTEERRRAREESFEEEEEKPLFQFPWQQAPAPKPRQKKYSGGQELTGFWLWLRDIYDQVSTHPHARERTET
jgi:hypothetical protein